MSDATPYRVSRHPEHGWRWWHSIESLPAAELDARPATEAETALIERIRRADRRNQKADAAGLALRALMEGRGG